MVVPEPPSSRYPVHLTAPTALTVAGRRLLPVSPMRIYTCGITPYDVTHVGHAATFVWADLLASVARATGAEPVTARNVTDVDDVLTAAASRAGKHYDEFALVQEFLFDRDMRALSVAEPTLTPHARAHIPAVVRLAAALLDRGAAYEHEGFVYFRGHEVHAGVGLDDDIALAASAEFGDQDDVPGRQSLYDVPVWRPSPEGHPAWPSPWGWGRPGWHAECAAMAVSSLGSSIDVLVGGDDLTYPHHAYQAAMVEAATTVSPFASAVMHVGEVRFEGAKMAKSTGNLVLVGDLLEEQTGPVVRLALLHRRYDQPWSFEPAVFEQSAALLDGLYAAAGRPTSSAEATRAVLDTLRHELDVPGAVTIALETGGDPARRVLDLLKLHQPA